MGAAATDAPGDIGHQPKEEARHAGAAELLRSQLGIGAGFWEPRGNIAPNTAKRITRTTDLSSYAPFSSTKINLDIFEGWKTISAKYARKIHNFTCGIRVILFQTE
jgi:hypothetical protein